MSLSSILFLAVILNLSIGIFVWRAQRKNLLNVCFATMSILIGIWVFLNYLFELHASIFLLKSIFALGPFIIIISFVWVHYIAEKVISKKFRNTILLLFLSAIITLYWIFSNGIIKEIITPTNVIFTNLYFYYTLYLVALFSSLLIYLFVEFRKSSLEQKHKFLYIFIGLFLFITAIILFSLVLPSLGYDRLSMLDGPSSIIFVGFTAYAILTTQLFDIRVALTQTATGIVILALLILTILSESLNQGIINGIILMVVVSGGYLLNKSVLNDIRQKEQLRGVNKQLESDKTELKELDRMKDEFLQMATHELNTPITVIQGRLSMALNENMCKLNNEQQEFLKPVLTDTMRLANLSKDILNVTRIDQHRFKLGVAESDLDALIAVIASDFEIKAKERGNMINYLKPESKIPKLGFDQTKIGEVISNLVNNANKFTKNGKITIASEIKDNSVVVSIADTGVGISQENQKHLFEKFYQAGRFDPKSPQEQQGTGLGLFISKNIIELHGGKMWLESIEGKGSTFYFSLPLKYKEIESSEKFHHQAPTLETI